jgi:hypothetical protein|tara:strand:- start:519 stop:710 length:192 start_codon:yes stop_codon:yes gene_type:complete
MPTKLELINECKVLGIKGYSKRNKLELEQMIHVKKIIIWYESIFPKKEIVPIVPIVPECPETY